MLNGFNIGNEVGSPNTTIGSNGDHSRWDGDVTKSWYIIAAVALKRDI